MICLESAVVMHTGYSDPKNMSEHRSQRQWVWQYRREFLQAAQRTVPGFGAWLRQEGLACEGARRWKAIEQWQRIFHLPEDWVRQSAWLTLAMWERNADLREQ